MTIVELKNKMCIPANASREMLEKSFAAIANTLLLHTKIVIGESIFYTIEEIEFYYYRDGCFNGPEYYCTYPRECDACDFFFHYSGVDICFVSTQKSFGGVLIRSLKRISKGGEELIGGPMRCSTDLMNTCIRTGNKLELLVSKHKIKEGPIKKTIRQGINADHAVIEDGEIKQLVQYCYDVLQKNNQHWMRTRKNVCEYVKDSSSESIKTIVMRDSKNDYYKDNPEDRIANLKIVLHRKK